LSLLAARLVEPRVERHFAAERRLHAKRARDQRGCEDLLGGEDSRNREGGRGLGAVDHRQAFLGREAQGLDPGPGEPLGGRQGLAFEPDFAFAEQRHAQMGERRQIARGADGTLGRNAGRDTGIIKRDQRVDQLRPNPGTARGQGVDLEQHEAPNHGLGQQRAGPGRVGQ
jgi:hypothetical protein